MPHANASLNSLDRLRLAYEAGWFAGERSRRRRGGRGWSRDDWAAAHRAFEEVLTRPAPESEVESPLPSMKCDHKGQNPDGTYDYFCTECGPDREPELERLRRLPGTAADALPLVVGANADGVVIGYPTLEPGEKPGDE